MTLLLARTGDEAQLYMDLHPCERCGSVDVDWRDSLSQTDGQLVRSYSGACGRCGTDREFLFRLPDPRSVPIATDTVVYGDDTPSELLDAGEWLWVAELAARQVPAEPAGARRALGIAAAAMDEVLKFIPADADEVPAAAFWSVRGRRVRDEDPGRFERGWLIAARNSYHAQRAAG